MTRSAWSAVMLWPIPIRRGAVRKMRTEETAPSQAAAVDAASASTQSVFPLELWPQYESGLSLELSRRHRTGELRLTRLLRQAGTRLRPTGR